MDGGVYLTGRLLTIGFPERGWRYPPMLLEDHVKKLYIRIAHQLGDLAYFFIGIGDQPPAKDREG